MLYSRNKGKSKQNFKILERTRRQGCGIAFSLFAEELGVVTRGSAPGAVHLRRPHEDLDVVEPAEDGREHVQGSAAQP